MKILIVEDVPLNLDLLVQILEDDHELLSADNGEDGVRLAAEARPDLILMDMSLPRVDGWEATRRIKADPVLRAIPIIALTAHAMRGDEERARAAGCDDFVAKPVDEDLLLARIEHWGPRA